MHDVDSLFDIIGHPENLKVFFGDCSVLLGECRAHPVQERLPELRSDQNNWKRNDLECLNQGQCLEEFVHRAESTGENDEAPGMLHEHDLADEEVSKGQFDALVWIRFLFEGQRDIQANGDAVGFERTLVRGLHDSWPASRDHREAAFRESPSALNGLLKLRSVWGRSRRAEYCNSGTDSHQCVGRIHEFAHDSKSSPGLVLQRVLGVFGFHCRDDYTRSPMSGKPTGRSGSRVVPSTRASAKVPKVVARGAKTARATTGTGNSEKAAAKTAGVAAKIAPAAAKIDISGYQAALKWLSERPDIERMRVVKYDESHFKLDRMRALLGAMGNPHEAIKTVHVAGTVGKGSTCAMIAHMLTECRYTVGIYTSPHFVDVRERIAIGDRMITKPAMVEMAKRVQAAAAKANVEPTFFEAMTAMAFKYFADEAVDIAVIEVGLGGRLDSTNVLTPLVSVVTTIDFDHTRILGETLPKIAREKAGIFKRGVPAIVFDSQPEVNRTFIEVADKVGAELRIVNKDIEFSSRFCTSPELGPHTRVCYYTKQSRIEHLPVPLPGEHQAINCGLALAAVECVRAAGFNCPENLVTGGLAKTKVMGRMDLISDRPQILVDGAHNPASLNALMRCVGAHVPYDSMVCVFGCCQDKDVGEMLDRLNLGADKVIFTRAAGNPRAADPVELQKLFQERSGKMSQVARTVGEAILLALRATSPDDLVCVTGSFYVVGDAMKFLHEQTGSQTRRSHPV